MKNNGNIIAELRREAGFTQKTLGEALNITSTAISKWERGLSLPDVALLPQLSALLDADIELLVQGEASRLHKNWVGLIDLRKCEFDLAQFVYDKPMVYYIVFHYLLLGIREIYVLGDVEKQSWLKWNEFQSLEIVFHNNPEKMPNENVMIMQQPCFLFGSDLTRRYQAAMSTGKLTKLSTSWNVVPFLFCPADYAFMYYKSPAYLYENATLKTLGRGMVCLPMDTPDQLHDVASFVRIYQHNTGLLIQDINEVSHAISKKQEFSDNLADADNR